MEKGLCARVAPPGRPWERAWSMQSLHLGGLSAGRSRSGYLAVGCPRRPLARLLAEDIYRRPPPATDLFSPRVLLPPSAALALLRVLSAFSVTPGRPPTRLCLSTCRPPRLPRGPPRTSTSATPAPRFAASLLLVRTVSLCSNILREGACLPGSGSEGRRVDTQNGRRRENIGRYSGVMGRGHGGFIMTPARVGDIVPVPIPQGKLSCTLVQSPSPASHLPLFDALALCL